MTNKFISKIESLFEQENHFSQISGTKNHNFIIEPNHKLLENINFDNNEKQWEIFFSRLTAFFEIGFYIENNFLKKYFHEGDFYDKQSMKLQFKLPQSELFHILKTNGEPLLQKIGLKHIENASKMTGLLIRLDHHVYIVLFTKQAEPWLQLRCESLKTSILKHDYFQNDI